MSKQNKITLTIDDDVADQLVCSTLAVSIDYLREDIKKLIKKKKLAPYEKEDLADFQRSLAALEEVFDYYGGNIK
mgnify:CR=1 FL=1